jgi:hypothetical protein
LKKLTKLTPKQFAQFPIQVKKWIDMATSGATDEVKARAALLKIYKLGGLKLPKVIIFLDSPVKCLLGRFYAAAYLDFFLKRKKKAQIYDQVHAQVHAQIDDQVGAQVGAQLHAQIDAQVRDQGKKLWQSYTFSIWWCAWLAYQEILCEFAKLDFKTEGIRDLFEARASWIWCYPEIVIICRMPKIIRDEKGRLHSIQGKAIEYPDGYGFYYLHGINFTEQEWRDFTEGKITAKDIMKEKNQDKKRVLAMEYGNAKMIAELKAGVRSEEIDDDGNLMRILSIARENDEDMVFYEGVDPAKNEKIYLRLPPEFKDKTPLEGKCWTFKPLWDSANGIREKMKFAIEA